ncbi:hypothetical protein ACJX0J_011907 [Zea mays]
MPSLLIISHFLSHSSFQDLQTVAGGQTHLFFYQIYINYIKRTSTGEPDIISFGAYPNSVYVTKLRFIIAYDWLATIRQQEKFLLFLSNKLGVQPFYCLMVTYQILKVLFKLESKQEICEVCA